MTRAEDHGLMKGTEDQEFTVEVVDFTDLEILEDPIAPACGIWNCGCVGGWCGLFYCGC